MLGRLVLGTAGVDLFEKEGVEIGEAAHDAVAGEIGSAFGFGGAPADLDAGAKAGDGDRFGRRRRRGNAVTVIKIPLGAPGALHHRVDAGADPAVLAHIHLAGVDRKGEIVGQKTGAGVGNARRLFQRAVLPFRPHLLGGFDIEPGKAAREGEMEFFAGIKVVWTEGAVHLGVVGLDRSGRMGGVAGVALLVDVAGMEGAGPGIAAHRKEFGVGAAQGPKVLVAVLISVAVVGEFGGGAHVGHFGLEEIVRIAGRVGIGLFRSMQDRVPDEPGIDEAAVLGGDRCAHEVAGDRGIIGAVLIEYAQAVAGAPAVIVLPGGDGVEIFARARGRPGAVGTVRVGAVGFDADIEIGEGIAAGVGEFDVEDEIVVIEGLAPGHDPPFDLHAENVFGRHLDDLVAGKVAESGWIMGREEIEADRFEIDLLGRIAMAHVAADAFGHLAVGHEIIGRAVDGDGVQAVDGVAPVGRGQFETGAGPEVLLLAAHADDVEIIGEKAGAVVKAGLGAVGGDAGPNAVDLDQGGLQLRGLLGIRRRCRRENG